MPFALPLIQSASQVAGLRMPDLDHPQIAPLFRIAEELRQRAGEDVLLHMVDLQSPMDIAALVWEKKSFFPALLEAPEAVHELADKIRTFQTQFLDEWFARFGREFIAHYPDYYMSDGVTFSVDEIGAVSPKVFRQFFLPELQYFAERYGAIGIHCCANARHQWEYLKQLPNLRLLNLNQPMHVTLESMSYFATDCVQWPVVQGENAGWNMAVEIPDGVRTVFEIGAASKDEALQVVERYRPYYC
jgi:uroporphyrinogen-III decarboxylase